MGNEGDSTAFLKAILQHIDEDKDKNRGVRSYLDVVMYLMQRADVNLQKLDKLDLHDLQDCIGILLKFLVKAGKNEQNPEKITAIHALRDKIVKQFAETNPTVKGYIARERAVTEFQKGLEHLKLRHKPHEPNVAIAFDEESKKADHKADRETLDAMCKHYKYAKEEAGVKIATLLSKKDAQFLLNLDQTSSESSGFQAIQKIKSKMFSATKQLNALRKTFHDDLEKYSKEQPKASLSPQGKS